MNVVAFEKLPSHKNKNKGACSKGFILHLIDKKDSKSVSLKIAMKKSTIAEKLVKKTCLGISFGILKFIIMTLFKYFRFNKTRSHFNTFK